MTGSIPPGRLEDADLILGAGLIGSRELWSEVVRNVGEEDLSLIDPPRGLLFRAIDAEWKAGRPPTPTVVEELVELRYEVRADVRGLLFQCYGTIAPYQLEHARGAGRRVATIGRILRVKQAVECLDAAALSANPDAADRALGDVVRVIVGGFAADARFGPPTPHGPVADGDEIARSTSRNCRQIGKTDLGDDLAERSGE